MIFNRKKNKRAIYNARYIQDGSPFEIEFCICICIILADFEDVFCYLQLPFMFKDNSWSNL
ncbi:hypothetical protein SAMN00777080_4980 [Aquiflexum balticum DSM 16537]|uniref:Uncharacterized protein n=1 Tax=Aquiflexum balticum DSM 16537 TaxID=758820 RepID=A0A1W2HC54_9BACT|nr:hypothetical protein SAMN00777080_4980 [Aquiflexum balticum DSM 16537]